MPLRCPPKIHFPYCKQQHGAYDTRGTLARGSLEAEHRPPVPAISQPLIHVVVYRLR